MGGMNGAVLADAAVAPGTPAARKRRPIRSVRHIEKVGGGFFYGVDDLEPLIEHRSGHQLIEILRSDVFGKMLRLDGALQCSEADACFRHEPLVHVALAAAPSLDRVLVVGGGDGGACQEALKWPRLKHLDHVEVDPDVLAICREHLRGVHGGVLDATDPRYHQTVDDVHRFLMDAPREYYDALILDLTDQGGPSTGLWTRPFFAACRRALRPGGALTLHVAAPWLQLSRCAAVIGALAAEFDRVWPYVVSVPVSGGQWTMALALDGAGADLAQPTFESLDSLRGDALKVLDDDGLQALLHPPPYLATALGLPGLRTAGLESV
jgi:spermidine synthase